MAADQPEIHAYDHIELPAVTFPISEPVLSLKQPRFLAPKSKLELAT